jgi:T5SS/PEP-CTERM-associated repeat protein
MPTNWSSFQVPNVSIDAYINNRGTAQISGPNAAAHSLTLGENSADLGTLVVDGVHGGSLTMADPGDDPEDNVGALNLGVEGTGTMIIRNGGSVSGRASLGYAAHQLSTSSGTATVDGAGSTWTVKHKLEVGGPTFIGGFSAPGLLSVTNGGTVIASPPLSIYINLLAEDSGTVTGNGTIKTIGGTMQTVVHGTLAPSGTLTLYSELQLNSTATTVCNVTPSGADNIQVRQQSPIPGDAFLGGRLSVTMTGTFTPGTTFTLLHAEGGLNQTIFDSKSIKYPTGQGFTPAITYDTNNVYLFLQPNQ